MRRTILLSYQAISSGEPCQIVGWTRRRQVDLLNQEQSISRLVKGPEERPELPCSSSHNISQETCVSTVNALTTQLAKTSTMCKEHCVTCLCGLVQPLTGCYCCEWSFCSLTVAFLWTSVMPLNEWQDKRQSLLYMCLWFVKWISELTMRNLFVTHVVFDSDDVSIRDKIYGMTLMPQ